VARSLGSAPLLHSVQTAFVHGLDVMLWCCAGIALASALLALAFLPRRAGGPAEAASAGTPAGTAGVPTTPRDPARAE
jgi:MFS transporter, DHA2 family, multidrug resistance protein